MWSTKAFLAWSKASPLSESATAREALRAASHARSPRARRRATDASFGISVELSQAVAYRTAKAWSVDRTSRNAEGPSSSAARRRFLVSCFSEGGPSKAASAFKPRVARSSSWERAAPAKAQAQQPSIVDRASCAKGPVQLCCDASATAVRAKAATAAGNRSSPVVVPSTIAELRGPQARNTAAAPIASTKCCWGLSGFAVCAIDLTSS
mmetsp:Transcript_11901/g.31248  ORF Transcript_11901/g.31248 Transcript_11901/m.31248 type:complete len:209 (-) Transcript_11901:2963-3589(-)